MANRNQILLKGFLGLFKRYCGVNVGRLSPAIKSSQTIDLCLTIALFASRPYNHCSPTIIHHTLIPTSPTHTQHNMSNSQFAFTDSKEVGGDSHFCTIAKQVGGASHFCVISNKDSSRDNKEVGGDSHFCVISKELDPEKIFPHVAVLPLRGVFTSRNDNFMLIIPRTP
ncbi:hypothetical protein O181_019442 [Austropuccinia psidii MF-1]|uniref:Uncharacterized protein n=1 Tax=Austropuccinia psidii MF-1 TaxID=1389203 RepID=A0A9Q3GUF2_9BASI|nr:hypothetical protein [Austropuccinia psidii MF-1]